MAVALSAANVSDIGMTVAAPDAIELNRRPGGRPGKRPEELHADKAYDRVSPYKT